MDFNEGVLDCKEYYKLNTLKAFTVMAKDDFSEKIEHKYILCPLSCRLELIIHKEKVPNEPKIFLKVIQSTFGVQVYLDYLSYILKMINFFKLFQTFKTGVSSMFQYSSMREATKSSYKKVYLE